MERVEGELYLFILCICKLRRFFNDEAILSIAYITYYLKKKKRYLHLLPPRWRWRVMQVTPPSAVELADFMSTGVSMAPGRCGVPDGCGNVQ